MRNNNTYFSLKGLGLAIVSAIIIFPVGFLTSSLFPIVVGVLGTIFGLALIYYSNNIDEENENSAIVGAFSWVVIIGAFLYWLAPTYQNLVYTFVIEFPVIIEFLVLLVVGFILGVLIVKTEKIGSLGEMSYFFLFIIFIIVFAIAAIFVVPGFTSIDMIDRTDSEEISTIPNTDVDNARIMPKAVGKNIARNSLQTPQYRLSNGDITFINDTPHWSWSLSPDGNLNYFTESQTGGIFVNQATTKKDIKQITDSKFKYGTGLQLTDNVYWQLTKDNYWRSYKDSFVITKDGEEYIGIPYMTHDVKFKFPYFYSVPKFGGVQLINTDGDIKDLTPQEALNNQALEGQNIYPYELARFKVKANYYREGIYNAYFKHKNQITVPSVPGQGNSQPFTIPTEEGIKYFVAAEPYGDSNGILEMWVIDGRTGKSEYISYGGDNSSLLRGARKSVEVVMGDPQIAPFEDVEGVEPLPVVVDNDLYWMVRIVPTSSSRITAVAFYNAQNDDVDIIESKGDATEKIKTFIRQGNIKQTPIQNNRTIIRGFTIEINREDGSRNNITIDPGDTVQIRNR